MEPDLQDFIQWHIDRCTQCASGKYSAYWDCPLFQEDLKEADARADYEYQRFKEIG